MAGEVAEPGRPKEVGGGGRVREVVRVEVGREVVTMVDSREVVQECLLHERLSKAEAPGKFTARREAKATGTRNELFS